MTVMAPGKVHSPVMCILLLIKPKRGGEGGKSRDFLSILRDCMSEMPDKGAWVTGASTDKVQKGHWWGSLAQVSWEPFPSWFLISSWLASQCRCLYLSQGQTHFSFHFQAFLQSGLYRCAFPTRGSWDHSLVSIIFWGDRLQQLEAHQLTHCKEKSQS